MNTVRHSGHVFRDLDGNSHEISFRGISERPIVESEPTGDGPVGVLTYETVDGTVRKHRIGVNEAAAVLDSYDRWAKDAT